MKTLPASVTQFSQRAALCSLLLLGGCAANPFTSQNLPADLHQTPAGGAISVASLLENARNNVSAGSSSATDQLTLTFAQRQTQLSEQQAEQLNVLANQHTSGAIQLDCAPSAASDAFIAMTQGMRRCVLVARFLENRARDTSIRMQPQLAHNQIVISQ